jgi:hypothetical protein
MHAAECAENDDSDDPLGRADLQYLHVLNTFAQANKLIKEFSVLSRDAHNISSITARAAILALGVHFMHLRLCWFGMCSD